MSDRTVPSLMSALGQKQTSRHVRVMSVIPLKVDIRQRVEHVRLVPEAEIRHGTAALAKWNGWHGQRADGGQLAPIRDQC